MPVAVTGLSRGSESAMLTAICAPDAVRGVIAAVPANVIAGSHPPGARPGSATAARYPTSATSSRPTRTRMPSSRSNGSAARCC
ncbi:MAG TPA: hypothetical protein VFQ68_07155 [Streptosporangiaceae bacterium]|nr:hypothetical protein [Streptosporangiaceae bacterium]